ncbi:MAG: AAA family ATPase [Burkholderiales bacterium]|nr:AAA family ATPase [Burkholderiales bacterium]
MYKDYFHLSEMPFSIAPNPRFLYMSDRHREALAHLIYGVQGEGGILLLTGEVGTGKTTLCRCLLEQIQSRCDVAIILNPKMSVDELLASICDEFHIEVPGAAPSVKVLVDAINRHLLQANAQGRRAVLIIDEAQNLHADVLEQLRLLTNLETNTRKLLQIILIGQPELMVMLRQPELRQVAQRIVARYHLGKLTRLEVAAYVAHRLRVSGTQTPILPYALIGTLYRLTGGVPRLINLVCDRALLGTYVQRGMQVTTKTLKQAATEVIDVSARQRRWSRLLAWPSLLLVAVCASGVFAASLVPLWPLSWPAPATASVATAPVIQTKQTKPAQALHGAPAAAGAAAAVAVPDPVATAAEGRPAIEELSWPDAELARSRSEALAFQDLLGLYGIAYDPGSKGAPCKIAETADMHCLSAYGGLSDLLWVNQPAVLLLDRAGKDRAYHVVLTGLDEASATLIVAGARRRVALSQIAQLWSGKYQLLWYAPPGFGNALTGGNRSPAATWLRQRLARVDGGATEGPAVFDDELVERVRSFQLAEGMAPDGAVGALTLIRLNQRVDQDLPRLGKMAQRGSNVLHP